MKLLKKFLHRALFFGKAHLIVAGCLLALSVQSAQTVTLAWDPSPDPGIASYRVHYGTASGVYGQTTNAGAATALTVSGLSEGATYFFAVTAVGTNQLESDFSNEVNYRVVATNSAPTITIISNRTINEDGNSGAIGFTVADGETSAGSLSLTASSGNPALVPTGNIVFGGSGGSRTVTVTPAGNASGSALITVTVSDGALSASQQFTLTVNSVNDAPTLAAIAGINVAQDAGQQTVNLSGIGSGAANESQTLTVTAVSSNPSLIPTPAITYSSPASTGSLRFTPAAGQIGSAQITVTVSDNGGTANGGVNSVQRSFVVNVIASANAAPTLATISNVSVAQDEGEPGLDLGAMGAGTMIWAVSPGGAPKTQTVSLSGISTGGESSQTLTVTATSSNPSLIPTPPVSYSSPASTGSLQLAPVVGATGSALITVTVKDNGGGTDTVQKSFTVNVTGPANSEPTITSISSQNMAEDTVLGPVGFSVNDAQTSAGSLVISAASGNATLLPNSALQLGGANSSRNFTLSPAANQSGKALVTLTVTDGGGAMASKSFWVNVNPVNDAPTLNPVADLVLSGEPVETVSLSGIGVGPLDGIQGLTVQAASSNPSVLGNPEVVYYSPNGTAELQLRPVTGASGSATITVTVKDDGGTASGGQDSVTRTFTVSAPAQVASSALVQGAQGVSAIVLAPAPQLQISVEGGLITLTWDGAAGPYSVERSPTFDSNATWSKVEETPDPVGASNLKITLRPEQRSEFFRLVRQ